MTMLTNTSMHTYMLSAVWHSIANLNSSSPQVYFVHCILSTTMQNKGILVHTESSNVHA